MPNTEDSLINEDNILKEPLFTEEGFVNPAGMQGLENAIMNVGKTHERLSGDEEWNKKHYVFVKDITSNLAKWAIKQSPYVYPEGLDIVVKYLNACLIRQADKVEMMNVSLCDVSRILYDILYEKNIESFDNWNKSKNPTPNIVYTSRYSGKGDPDDGFIDLDALLHNVCLSLREEFRAFDKFNKEFDEKYGKLPE